MPSRLPPLLPLAVAVAACTPGGAAPPAARGAVPVRIAPVLTERIAPPVVATGVLGAKEEVALSFKVGGVVARVPVDEGRSVRAGETLAALDLSEIDAGVTRARSAAEKAERDLARARRLYADSVATLEQLQNAETGVAVARAGLETATFNRRHAVIVAPADGVILRRAVEPGELVAPGAPVLTLASHARGFVMRIGLADRDVVRVRRGDSALVRFEALPDRDLAGRVSEIARAADPPTGTYRVEVRLSAAEAAELPTGLVGRVEIRPATMRLVAVVPVEALLEADGSRGTVFALSADGRRAEKREVTIAFAADDGVALAAGLEGVRAVITAGAAYLDDGAAVKVRP